MMGRSKRGNRDLATDIPYIQILHLLTDVDDHLTLCGNTQSKTHANRDKHTTDIGCCSD